MENVSAFNNELSGLYDSKPPISKAKMAAITRAAMKAIKFYKHVVQSVEKFILKCKPEYKIPGLYVIDSIVRQSRHQFGQDKDVFAQRFARNVKSTFANLFRGAPEDKSRIIRVLNLWQKNNVFAPEVIQPLFDLADPNHPIYQLPPGTQDAPTVTDINGINASTSGDNNISTDSDNHGIPDLTGNNLSQLLKDPNVLRQLQTLQQYKKQQEEKQIKLNEMRIQEEAFEKHLQNVLKGTSGPSGISVLSASQLNADSGDKEIEFVSDDTKIEVINLDGNDSRSPTPDRDRYTKRRRSRSRSRDRSNRSGMNDRDRRRRSRSRTRSRSPKGSSGRRRGSSRDRNDRGGGGSGSSSQKDRDRDKEKEREYERERRRKGLPDIKKEHLSVCSTTLWVGHLSKLVQQEELSDSFGKYGEIVSIDMINPRGCAFIVMHRRQDAYKSMGALKNHKMQGRIITISWAAGKGVKSKEWKDFWDLELGVSYIPWNKIDMDTDLDALEEGGMFDEDSMPPWMKDRINEKKNNQDNKLTAANVIPANTIFSAPPGLESLQHLDTTQPPPNAGVVPLMPPPNMPFQLGPAVPRMMGPMGMPPGMAGLPPMPQIVAGMPPPGMIPHGMMPPAGMMSSFPPMPPLQLDKNVGSPAMGGSGPSQNDGTQFMTPLHMPPMPPHLGISPQFQQPPPNQQGGNIPVPQVSNTLSDDQMDIEMDDEMININNVPSGGKLKNNYNQPPPLFPNFPTDILSSGENRRNDRNDERREMDFGGNRNRDGGNEMLGGEFNNRGGGSRWGDRRDRGRHNRDGNNDQGHQAVWQENGMGNFQGPNFNDNARPGMNIPPLDITKPPNNPFFDMRDDFNDDRRGNNGPRDFFPNNRFGGPMQQMRGGPQFGPRMGNIFMRGNGPRHGPQGGVGGGGNFGHNNFNDRPPFDREDRGGNGGRGMRGGNNMMDRRGGGRGNWRDDDEMIDRDRGGGRRGAGRFQNRDRNDNRENRERDRDRGGAIGSSSSSGSGGRDRNSRERGPTGNDRRNRRNSSNRGDDENKPQQQQQQQINPDNNNSSFNKSTNQLQSNSQTQDTEEDWDNELKEFNTNKSNEFNEIAEQNEITENSQSHDDDTNFQSVNPFLNNVNHENDYNHPPATIEQNTTDEDIFVPPAVIDYQHTSNNNTNKREFTGNFNNTPLYDEPNESSGSGGGNSQQNKSETNTFDTYNNNENVTDNTSSPPPPSISQTNLVVENESVENIE